MVNNHMKHGKSFPEILMLLFREFPEREIDGAIQISLTGWWLVMWRD
jgi:hypothetical protein